MKKTLILLFLSIFSLGCIQPSNGQNLTDQQKLSIENQVDSIFHVMVKAAEDLNYDLISTGVDDHYHAGFIVNNTYFAKYDSLISILKSNMRSGMKQSISIQKEKITALSDHIALLTAFGEATAETNPGQTFTVKFYWSFVYEKINNQWKVIQSHQSNNR